LQSALLRGIAFDSPWGGIAQRIPPIHARWPAQCAALLRPARCLRHRDTELWFIAYIYETRSVSFNLPTTDKKIEIRHGDLFEQPTDWLIGVGEFFDSDVGQVVSKNSLHGKLISP
jgi:hypothetical protein